MTGFVNRLSHAIANVTLGQGPGTFPQVGFVAAEAINPLGSDQLCYGKDASGAWKIVGMIGGG